jgi:tRNA G26 N,N-dimethylase Trm1
VECLLRAVVAYKEQQISTFHDNLQNALQIETHIPTAARLAGLLTAITEELNDVPLYYSLPELAATLHSTTPLMQVVLKFLIFIDFSVFLINFEVFGIF